jgi:hypothetical protein
MSKATRDAILFTLGYAAAGLAASIAVGCLAYRRECFHFPEPLLSLLLLGLAGALIYASAQMSGAGYAILVIALSFMARVALTPRTFSLPAAAIYSLIIGLALLAGAYAQKALAGLRFGRFIGMGLALGAGYALMTLLMLVTFHGQIHLRAIFNQALLGAGLGAAIGLGFELIDLIAPRPENGLYLGPAPLDNNEDNS